MKKKQLNLETLDPRVKHMMELLDKPDSDDEFIACSMSQGNSKENAVRILHQCKALMAKNKKLENDRKFISAINVDLGASIVGCLIVLIGLLTGNESLTQVGMSGTIVANADISARLMTCSINTQTNQDVGIPHVDTSRSVGLAKLADRGFDKIKARMNNRGVD